jgi:hypothetical protein
MALAVIKEEYRTKRVGFGNSATLLGNRTDIDDLAIMALESQDKSLLILFEQPMPLLAALKKNKTEAGLKRPVAVVPK